MKYRLALLAALTASAACGVSDYAPPLATEHPRIYLPAHRERLAATLASGDPAASRFKASADRWVAGTEIWGFQGWHAALIGQLTGDPKYCAAAVAAVDQQVRSAHDAIVRGEAPPVVHNSYIGIGELIGDLALVYDWCFEEVGDRRMAWLGYANQAVWNVWNYDNAAWGDAQRPWSGWATSDPSNNYHYSFLRATMLLGLAGHDDFAGADEWVDEFRNDLIADELLPTFDADLAGGGSREGTGYGVAMRTLFELYDLWEGSTGERLAAHTEHTRASMLAFMHQTLPTLDRVAPTGDHSRDSEALFFDYHRQYLQELVHLFPDDPLAPRAQALIAASSVPRMENQFMFAYDFLYASPQVPSSSLTGLGTAYHAPGIGELYARSSWEKDATWVNLIAGPYTQSHAHQDQGSIMIYKEGWLAYDANIDSRSGLRQEVGAHSLVKIVEGGAPIEQRSDTSSKLVALHRGDGWLHASADLTPAYKNHAAVQKVERELLYLEPDIVVVYDRVTTRAAGQQVWQLASPTSPSISGARATFAANGHSLTVHRIQPVTATTTVHSYATDPDFRGGFRLDTTVAGGDQRFLHVLAVDGAVTATTAEADGVTVTLATGGTARVRFQRNAFGCSLTLGGITTALGAGVDSLRE